MSTGPLDTTNSSQSQYYKVTYSTNKGETPLLERRTIKVQDSDTDIVLRIKIALDKALSPHNENISTLGQHSVTNSSNPTNTEQKTASTANQTIHSYDQVNLEKIEAVKENINKLSQASVSQSWTSWFLSFFNFFSRKESTELATLFNIENNDDSFLKTLEIFEKSLPADDTQLKPKITDAIENTKQLKEKCTQDRQQGINEFIDSIFNYKCSDVNKECIIPISTSINGKKIPSFLVIKLDKKITSSKGSPAYQYSLTKVGFTGKTSNTSDKAQMIRSFACNHNRLREILKSALNDTTSSADTEQKLTTLDTEIDNIINNPENNPENSKTIVERPLEEEESAAFTKPKEDPLSLCLLLGKQSTGQLISKIKTDLEKLEEEKKECDQYFQAKAFLENLKISSSKLHEEPITSPEKEQDNQIMNKKDTTPTQKKKESISVWSFLSNLWVSNYEPTSAVVDQPVSVKNLETNDSSQTSKRINRVKEYLPSKIDNLEELLSDKSADSELIQKIIDSKKVIALCESEELQGKIKKYISELEPSGTDNIEEDTSASDPSSLIEKLKNLLDQKINKEKENLKKETENIKSREYLNKPQLLYTFVANLAERFITLSSQLSNEEVDKAALELDIQLTSTQSKLSKLYGDAIAQEFVSAIRAKVDNRISRAKERIDKKETSTFLKNVQSAAPRYTPKFTITEPKPIAQAEVQETVLIVPTLKLQAEEIDKIQAIKKAFAIDTTSQNAKELANQINDLEAFVEKADELIEDKKYADARLYLQTVLSNLPNHKNNALLSIMGFPQLKKIAKIAINALEKLLEAKLRLSDPLMPSEEFNSFDNALKLSSMLPNKINEFLIKTKQKEKINFIVVHLTLYLLQGDETFYNFLNSSWEDLKNPNSEIHQSILDFLLVDFKELFEDLNIKFDCKNYNQTKYSLAKLLTDDGFKKINFAEDQGKEELNDIFKKYQDDETRLFNILPDLNIDSMFNLQRKQEFLTEALQNMEEYLFTSETPNYDQALTTEEERRRAVIKKRKELFHKAQSIEGRLIIKPKKLANGDFYLGFGSKDSDDTHTEFFCTSSSPATSFDTGCVAIKEALGSNNVVLHFMPQDAQLNQWIKWIREKPICDIDDRSVQMALSTLKPQDSASVLSALIFIRDNPSYLDSPTVIEKIRTTLDDPKKIEETLSRDQNFWNENKGALKAKFDQAIVSNNTTAALFIAEFFSRIKQADSGRKDPPIRYFQNMNDLNLDTKVNDNDSLLDYSLDKLTTKNGPYTYSTLLILSLLDNKKISELQPETIAKILFCWKKTLSEPTEETGTIFLSQIKQKMEEELLPAFEEKIDKNNKDTSTILSSYFEKITGNKNVLGWIQVQDHKPAYTYVKKDPEGKKTHSIDIRSGIIAAQNYSEDSKVQLSEAIKGKEEFIQVFGTLSDPISADKKFSDDQETYTFKIGRNKFEIIVNSMTQEIGSICLLREDKRYIHCTAQPDSQDKSALGKVIQDKGLWHIQHSAGREYFLIHDIKKENPLSDPTTVSLKFDSKFLLTSAMAGKKHVSIDRDQKHEGSLPMIGSKNLLFTSTQKQGKIDRITIIDQGKELEKTKDGWKFSGSDEVLSENSIHDMQTFLGRWSKNVILPFQRASSNEATYYLFMRPLDMSSIKGKNGAFRFSNTEDPCPTTTISKNKDGVLTGDCPAFLYLSMASFAAGDIEKASRFLDMMQDEQTQVGDKNHLKILAEQLKTIPGTTTKAIAYLLKAELMVQKKLLTKLSPEDTSRIFKLADQYQASKNISDKQIRLESRRLLLTDQELHALDYHPNDDLQATIQQLSHDPQALKEHLKEKQFNRIHQLKHSQPTRTAFEPSQIEIKNEELNSDGKTKLVTLRRNYFSESAKTSQHEENQKNNNKSAIDTNKKEALDLFPQRNTNSSGKLEEREIDRLIKGIEKASDAQKQKIDEGQNLKVPYARVEELKKTLEQQLEDTKQKTSKFRASILTSIKPYKISLGAQLIQEDENLLLRILELYEDGALAPKLGEEVARDIEQNIFLFLTYSTKEHLLEKALYDPAGSLACIEELKNKLSTKDLEPNAETDLDISYSAACFDFYQKLERGYDLKFFLGDDNKIKDEMISRAAMVFGYKNRIGARKDQIEVIKKILESPNCLEEIRMGLGKSFFISPMIAKLMSKKGILPVVLFTEQMIDLSKKDMANDAFEFKFLRSDDHSEDKLLHLLKTLLEVKQSRRYIITTAS